MRPCSLRSDVQFQRTQHTLRRFQRLSDSRAQTTPARAKIRTSKFSQPANLEHLVPVLSPLDCLLFEPRTPHASLTASPESGILPAPGFTNRATLGGP